MGGWSWSIAVVAIGPILGAALVFRYAPESMGLTLEEVQERLSGKAEPPPPPPDRVSAGLAQASIGV